MAMQFQEIALPSHVKISMCSMSCAGNATSSEKLQKYWKLWIFCQFIYRSANFPVALCSQVAIFSRGGKAIIGSLSKLTGRSTNKFLFRRTQRQVNSLGPWHHSLFNWMEIWMWPPPLGRRVSLLKVPNIWQLHRNRGLKIACVTVALRYTVFCRNKAKCWNNGTW